MLDTIHFYSHRLKLYSHRCQSSDSDEGNPFCSRILILPYTEAAEEGFDWMRYSFILREKKKKKERCPWLQQKVLSLCSKQPHRSSTHSALPMLYHSTSNTWYFGV